MAIQIDPALNLMPTRTQQQMDDELRFSGYPKGRGPISEAVMPLNNVLIERANKIRLLEAAVRRQKADIERKDAALRVALAALEYHTIQTRPIHSTDVAITTLREAL